MRAKIEQKPHRASLSAILQFYHIFFLPLIVIFWNLFVYLGGSQNLLKCIPNTFIPLQLNFLFSMKLALAGLSNRSESLIWHFHL